MFFHLKVVSRHHLDNISRLKLYSYQLATAGGSGETSPSPEKGMSHRTQVGLLAQEVQQVIPDAVIETVSPETIHVYIIIIQVAPALP